MVSPDAIKAAKDLINAYMISDAFTEPNPDQFDYARGSMDFINPDALTVGNGVLVYLTVEFAGFINYMQEYQDSRTAHEAEVLAAGGGCCCCCCGTTVGLAGDDEVIFFLEDMNLPLVINNIYDDMIAKASNFLGYIDLLSSSFTMVSGIQIPGEPEEGEEEPEA